MPASQNKELVALWVVKPEDAAFECRLVLAKHAGNVAAAATELRVTRQALYGWMRKHPLLFEKTVSR